MWCKTSNVLSSVTALLLGVAVYWQYHRNHDQALEIKALLRERDACMSVIVEYKEAVQREGYYPEITDDPAALVDYGTGVNRYPEVPRVLKVTLHKLP